jgi:Arc/MetJ-type ribon-helix-helix transcriptional regulator
MSTTKAAIALDEKMLDRLVKARVFPNLSKAIQEAVEENPERLEWSRLARKCAKFDGEFEKAMAEEGTSEELGR